MCLLLLPGMQRRAAVRRYGRKECISFVPFILTAELKETFGGRGNVSPVKPLVFMAFKVQSLLFYLCKCCFSKAQYQGTFELRSVHLFPKSTLDYFTRSLTIY